MNLNEVSKQHEPLSWTEARSHLREVLEDYLQDPNPKRKKETNFDYKHNSLVSFCISCDLDLYAGALFFSLLLLILTCTSFFAKRDGFGQSLFKPKADLDVYIFQVSAAVLLCSGSLLSLWMVRRRRFLCLNDSSNSKRREILKFLRSIEVDEEHARTQGSNIGLAGKSNNSTNFSGTAQTDIYPVYRKVSDSKGSESASWNRIPSLLLVRGDFLALQVGDIVPANCVAINDLDSPRQTLRLNIGERLSILSLNENTNHVIESLPKGRTTLQPNSKSFLTLCNNLQIFRVVETPMKDFIRRATGTLYDV